MLGTGIIDRRCGFTSKDLYECSIKGSYILIETYKSETCSVTKALERSLRRSQRSMESVQAVLVDIKLRNWKRTSWIREQTKLEKALLDSYH